MISAEFHKKDNGSIHMTLRGHAGAAPKGEDLVCASATILVYAVAQAVNFFHEQGKLKRKPKIDIRDGCATVIATPTDEGYAEVLHTFWVAQCGIHVLAHNYPKNVRFAYLTL